jgi:hypothetical protein
MAGQGGEEIRSTALLVSKPPGSVPHSARYESWFFLDEYRYGKRVFMEEVYRFNSASPSAVGLFQCGRS